MSYKTLFNSRLLKSVVIQMNSASYSSGIGEQGSGAGKGGGGGGTIRSAGGSFGKREAALEGEYFNRLQQKQLQDIKELLHDEVKFHEEQVQRHQDALEKAKKRLNESEQDK